MPQPSRGTVILHRIMLLRRINLVVFYATVTAFAGMGAAILVASEDTFAVTFVATLVGAFLMGLCQLTLGLLRCPTCDKRFFGWRNCSWPNFHTCRCRHCGISLRYIPDPVMPEDGDV